MIDILNRPMTLVVLCALAYAAATLAMKTLSIAPTPAMTILLCLALAGAVAAEILLLQRHTLGITYITILAAETLLVLGIAAFIGEGLGPRELVGVALVLGGTAVIWA